MLVHDNQNDYFLTGKYFKKIKGNYKEILTIVGGEIWWWDFEIKRKLITY